MLLPEFSLQDIKEEKISYVQSQHQYQEPTKDSFMIHLTDGTNNSPTVKVPVLIEVSNLVEFMCCA